MALVAISGHSARPDTSWFWHLLIGFCAAFWFTAMCLELPWKIARLVKAIMRG
jgi:hypothetical protein